jgi:7-cyano-7-deazaguanine synthase
VRAEAHRNLHQGRAIANQPRQPARLLAPSAPYSKAPVTTDQPDTASRAASTAVVLFSGGQDSTTCLAWALQRFERVETVAFDYRQRHAVELECRLAVRRELAARFPGWARKLGDDHLVDLGVLGAISDTALTRTAAIEVAANGLPTTFVPGRNLIFLSFAGAIAYRRGARHIVTGVCETDFSGYPDCRDDTIKAMQLALNLGMDQRFVIHTPLMWIDKGATWNLAAALGCEALVEVIREHTHTCYHGVRDRLHDWGYGCGECPACALRAKGYARFRARQGGDGSTQG